MMTAPQRPAVLRGWMAGALGVGALRVGALALGPSPAALSALGLAIVLGAVAAPRLQRASRAALIVGAWVGMAILEGSAIPSLPAALRALPGQLPWLGLPVAGLVLGLGLGPALSPSRLAPALAVAAGVAIGAVAPLPWVPVIAAPGLFTPHPGHPPHAEGALPRAAGAAAVGIAVGTTALTLRPALDTSAQPLWFAVALVVVGSAAFDAVGARIRTSDRSTPSFRSLLTGGVAAVVASALLPFGVGLCRALAAPLIAAPGPDLRLSLPTLAAGAVGGSLLAISGPPGGARTLGFAAGVALAASPWGDNGALLGAAALGCSLSLALLSDRRTSQLAGALTAVALGVRWAALKALPVTALTSGLLMGLRNDDAWQRTLDARIGATPAAALVGGRGGVAVWSAQPALVEVELDGRPRSSTGAAAEAEGMAGALAGLLSPRLGRALILGDDAGNVVRGAGPWPFLETTVATPAPEATRAIAAGAPAIRDRYLAPGVRLMARHPSHALRSFVDLDVIVLVVDGPWSDAAHAGPDPVALRAARTRLKADGVWIGLLHLDQLEDGEAAAFAGAVASVFPSTQAWLPPTGADSLILVGAASPLPLSRVEERFGAGAGALRSLGFPSAAAVASQAVADGEGLGAWSDAHAATLDPDRLHGTLTVRPVLHLGGLADRTASARRLWDLTSSSVGIAALDGRIDVRRRTLRVLAQAAEGDMRGVVQGTRDLSTLPEADASKALDGLIAPQVRQAEEALRRAQAEGPRSSGWEEASRAATTARMLAPTATAPLMLLAEVALAQGNLAKANEHFSAALALEADALGGHFGLARVARARGDLVAAETHLMQATRLHPRQAQVWHNLGIFWMEQGRLDEAEEALNRGAGLADAREAGPSLGLAELALRRGQPGSALVWAERAVKITELAKDSKAIAQARYLRGRAYFDMQQWDKAEDDLRAAVIADGQLVAARGGIGQLRAQKGDLTGAIEAFKLVLAIDPNNVPARENLRRAEQELRARDARGPAAPPPPPPGFAP